MIRYLDVQDELTDMEASPLKISGLTLRLQGPVPGLDALDLVPMSFCQFGLGEWPFLQGIHETINTLGLSSVEGLS